MVADMAVSDPHDPNYQDPVFVLHRGGKMEIAGTVPMQTREDLSLAYTPGVARVCQAIASDPTTAHDPPGSGTPSRWSRTVPPCSAWATSARPPLCR
jgi:malic enzyme